MLSRFSSRRHLPFATALLMTLVAGITVPYAPAVQAQLAPSDVSGLAASLPAATGTAPTPVAAVELAPAPPNLTQGVAPNIVVTFDDSGSMASNYMGDKRPFDNQNWGGPWRCAAVIDPRITDSGNLRSLGMNGVYYNPLIIYKPPVRADGTSFPDADVSLQAVWLDGITINRPRNHLDQDAVAGYYNNIDGVTDTTHTANLVGTNNQSPAWGWYWAGSRSPSDVAYDSAHGSNSSKNAAKAEWKAGWVYGQYPSVSGDQYYSTSSADSQPSIANNGSLPSNVKKGPYPASFDARWTCGNGSSSPIPGGGPYYYRYKTSAPNIPVDANGNPDPTNQDLYKTSNWEAVAIGKDEEVKANGVTVNAWQNFANWYAYYRTRNLMTRTSLSRVFGALGNLSPAGDYGSPVRVAWQNINDSNYKLPTQAIISSLLDIKQASNCVASKVDPKATQRDATPKIAPDCYRSAFFNWIFEVDANGGTPNRASTIRAGDFFTRGNGNTGDTGDLTDPYWQPPSSTGGAGQELTCRQNFHMLVTDGYWNEGNPTVPDGFFDVQGTPTLGDSTTVFVHDAVNKIFWNVPSSDTGNCNNNNSTDCYPSLADIAFYYWATDLRSDLANTISAYIADTSTGVTTPGSTADEKKSEIYWNPANDPATWQHLVQFMVTLGVPGVRRFPNDLTSLRDGTLDWPKPARNAPASIDDTWHAAVNSRGSYFNAGNPQTLIDELGRILSNISDRSGPVATTALNTSVLVQGALGFATGYNASDWSGTLQAVSVNSDGTTSKTALWSVSDYLDKTPSDPAPDKRNILTSKLNSSGQFAGGADFTYDQLDSAGQTLISTVPASVSSNDSLENRVNYLRGSHAEEAAGVMRQRTHLLGAIVNSQAVYEAYPSSGYRNAWPSGSPEATAAALGGTYEQFVKDHISRKPLVYVGANDGMLHAFDASVTTDTSAKPPIVVPASGAGKEVFAYVPRAVYGNLGNLTRKSGFVYQPTVDATPVVRDVFFSQTIASPVATSTGWHTILVGGLRLGGRGVYALDVTDPANMGAGKVLWEFSADNPDQAAWTDGDVSNPGGKPSDLGYTYGQPNIGRLSDGRWVVLVPGGYFPDCSQSDKPLNCDSSIPAAANKFSSLFVLDAQTGKLIREIKTSDSVDSGDVVSHGLASPVLGDYNDDQVDDVAFAGDLNGNLWRFDLSDPDPNNWAVTLSYKPTTDSAQPITVMPRLFPDPVTNRFIVVFGTGKYLGARDNSSIDAKTQSIYGIRDTGSTFTRADLVGQTMVEATSDDGKNVVRGITDNSVPAGKGGWYVDLNLSTALGERVVVTPGALFDSNRVVITTLIPGTNDPCNATIQGAVMVLNAATGGSGGGLSQPSVSGWSGSSVYRVVGARVNNPPTGGSLPLATKVGGGSLLAPGLSLTGGGVLGIDDAIWRRRSWRELNNL